MAPGSENGTLRAYIERMRELAKSVSERNDRIHDRSRPDHRPLRQRRPVARPKS